MVDVKEKDEASKSNSSFEKSAAQIVLTPATVSSTSIMSLEKTVDGPGSTDSMKESNKMEDEGNAMVGLKIDQGHIKEKALTEGETDKAQAVREDAVRGKDDEKTEEQINGMNLSGSSKGKGIKPRKRNKKKKVAQKASEMVVGDGNEGNATVAANNEGFTIDEEHGKEKAIGEEHIDGGNLGGSSRGKRSKRRKMNKKKKIAQKASEMVVWDGNDGNATVAANNEGLTIDGEHSKEKAIGEEETHEEEAVKEASIKGEAEEKTDEKKHGENFGKSSNGKGRKPRRNRKKKVAQKASEMVIVDGDKPESSSKKKASKKVESMGMVFMCSSKTKADCFRYKILGLPAGKKDQVAKIYNGMRLFLFDIDLRLMYGIFKAVGAGGYNIEPKAFKSAFPSQVRFTVIEDCLPLAEEKFRNVISYYTRKKFECQLNAQQVKKLCQLFVAGKSGPSPKKAIKNHQSVADESRRSKADAYTANDGVKRKRRAREEERQPHPPLGRERRRYHDYGQTPVIYEREALPSPVGPVARYPPLPPQDLAPVRSYGYERTYSYPQDPVSEHRSYRDPVPEHRLYQDPVPEHRSYRDPVPKHRSYRDPVPEHRSYRVLDTEPRHHDGIVGWDQERDRDRHHLYSREPPTYRDNVYPSIGQTVKDHHLPGADLSSEYRLVTREYPPARAAEYHLSGGLHAPGYLDVGRTSEYHSSAASLAEYRGRGSRYGY